MPHAHHFLERLDRVTRDQTAFALSLYQDHEAVAYVLTHVNLPEAAARVALAVGDDREGPVVVVTRDGKFVTCLGAGMRHEHPIVPRRQIEALLAKVAEKRARKELLRRELRPDEEEGDILQRIFTRGMRFAREDFLVVTSFEPLLGLGPFLSMIDVGIEAVKARVAMAVHADLMVVNGATKKALERLDRREWAAAHLTVLAGAASRRQIDEFLSRRTAVLVSPTSPCSAQGGSTFYLRAAWMAARFGKALIPSYKAALLAGQDWMSLLDAGLCLAAIGLRHASAMGEVKHVLEGYPPTIPNPTTPDQTRANIAHAMLNIIANAEEHVEAALKNGRLLAVSWSQFLPAGHPKRFPTEESVPDDVARTCVLTVDANMFDTRLQGLCLTALPLAARAAGEDFYHPRDTLRTWFGPWTHEEALLRLQRYAAAIVKVEPTRTVATPGRNDPCSCGSGKKWKKCHGAG